MFVQRSRKWSFYHLKLFVLATLVTIVGISTFFATDARAASPSTHQGKTIGAKLIVNGKTIILVPTSAIRASSKIGPNASQDCVYVYPSETNIYKTNTAAYFDYSLKITNACTNNVWVVNGYWNSRGSIVCDGVSYSNPPTGAGHLPVINSGRSALVQDNVPYAAVCVGQILGVPYEYPPSSISVASLTNGNLSDTNTFADSQEDTFNP